jgi:hypothetical protein
MELVRSSLSLPGRIIAEMIVPPEWRETFL